MTDHDHDLVSLLEGQEATCGDMAEMRHEMQLGFARIDARFAHLEVALEKGFEKGLREQTRFFFLALPNAARAPAASRFVGWRSSPFL